jgi:hypothetical protein
VGELKRLFLKLDSLACLNNEVLLEFSTTLLEPSVRFPSGVDAIF